MESQIRCHAIDKKGNRLTRTWRNFSLGKRGDFLFIRQEMSQKMYAAGGFEKPNYKCVFCGEKKFYYAQLGFWAVPHSIWMWVQEDETKERKYRYEDVVFGNDEKCSVHVPACPMCDLAIQEMYDLYADEQDEWDETENSCGFVKGIPPPPE